MTGRTKPIGDIEVHPFRFGTKADTLARLAPLLKLARLCEQIVFKVEDWRADRQAVTTGIVQRFPDRPLAVRSSSIWEDSETSSNAGRFASVTDVAAETAAIAEAVERVITSYGANAAGQQILVQPMVNGVALAGVVLTRDLDTGSPYYVINYDDFTGRTDTVTAGAISKMALVHRSNPEALHSPRMRAIIAAVEEIEAVTGSERLDIEFCMTADLTVTVLQVRPLAAGHRWLSVSDDTINRAIAEVRTRVHDLQAPVIGLAGKTTILGEMPDWNPAEMIGTAPRRLASSLYRRLITDSIWSAARATMGYREVGRPLMQDFAGRPYIDVRLSLNSFLPAGIDDSLANRIVDTGLALLTDQPQHHDKIEFEIAITCRDFDFETAARRYADAGLTSDELSRWERALVEITSRQLAAGRAGIQALVDYTRSLLNGHRRSTDDNPLRAARELLDETARNGTLPFSILARHAFIGAAMLRSLVARGILPTDQADRFMRSIRTVAADVVDAMAGVASGRVSQSEFLDRYGHLRPGTYDILSWRYDERPDLYLGQATRNATEREPFTLSAGLRAAIDAALQEAGYVIDADGLFDYIAAAITAREDAKFAFSRGISDALADLAGWSENNDLTRQILSHLTIEEILQHGSDVVRLRDIAARGEAAHVLTRALRFPHLIVEPDDLDVVRPLRGQPTFITNETVTARVVCLNRNEIVNLAGAIVMIESADPGYDWIFSHDIKGLVTEHGGANSHMAIRCAEFGLPAAIGCGERVFRSLAEASVIELNAGNRTLRGH